MRYATGAVCIVALLSQTVYAQQETPGSGQAPAATSEAGRLPVKRVVLYKNGVGFFEHLGRVSGTQQVSIDFTSAQLNDALKSLTTVDLGNGKVTGISFNTDDPASRRLGSLMLPLGEETNVLAFLGALRGARVDVQAGGVSIVGRVLSVEARTQAADGKLMDQRELALVTDAGELKTVEVGPRVSVRVLDSDVRSDVRRYLDIVSSTRQRDLRRMTIATAGTGERQLYVSYISEVPIWKSTYRLVLPRKSGDKPFLQGWAIVDNTIGEDWDRVELSLVAGAPQSFIQQLSQPLYARRPVVPLPSTVQLTPQTHEATLGAGAGVAESAAMDTAPRRAFALAPSVVAGSVPGGVVGGVVGGVPEAPPAPAPMARERAADAMAKVEAAAQGKDLGDLFEYQLKEPVTIRKNQSALVPILNGAVDAERVSVWNASTGARPRVAVWLTNSTALTLDGGSISVLEDATFTGEGVIDAIKPGERRLLSYAADASLLVDARADAPEPEKVTSVRMARGVLVMQREYRDRRTYTVRNEDAKSRTLVIEHPNRPGWRLTQAPPPAETAPGVYRFRLAAAPKASSTLTVEEMRAAETTYRVSSVTEDQVSMLVQQRALSAELEQSLRRVLAKKGEVAAVAADIEVRNAEVKRIFDDQARVRENLKALGGRNEERSLVARYTRELDEQENRLAALKGEIAERETRRQKLQAELDALIAGL